MARIFISYRRADSRDATERIHDRLVQVFENRNVFLDVDNHIPVGSSFPDVLRETLDKAEIVLVIIGDKWLDITEVDNPDLRRLDNPLDYVRLEIESALNKPEILVIPVLFDTANMPTAKQLPESLRELANKQAMRVRRNPDFHDDMEKLIAIIRADLDEKEEKRHKLAEEAARLEQQRLRAEERQKLQEREAIAAREKALAEQKARDEAAAKARRREEELKNKELATDRILSALDIPAEALARNRENQLTETQIKGIKIEVYRNIVTYIFLIVGVALISWFGVVVIENSFWWIEWTCIGTMLLVVGLYFIMGLVGVRRGYTPRLASKEGTLLVKVNTAGVPYLIIGSENFLLKDLKQPMSLVQEFEGRWVKAYYVNSPDVMATKEKEKFLMSIEVLGDAAPSQ